MSRVSGGQALAAEASASAQKVTPDSRGPVPPGRSGPAPARAAKARRPKARPRSRRLRPEWDLAQRLELHGERSLTDAELVALTGGLDTQHAVELLEGAGGLARLRVNLGDALPDASLAAARLRACLELSKRLLRAKLPTRKLLNRPPAVAKYLLARYSQPAQEVAGALFLDSSHRLIEERELFRGHRGRCTVSPEPVLRHAVQLGTPGVLAWHIQAGGAAKASREDAAWVERLEEACEVVGVVLVDYLILGGTKKWSSMRKEGLVGRTDTPEACTLPRASFGSHSGQ